MDLQNENRELNKLRKDFAVVMRRLVDTVSGNRPLAGFQAGEEFDPDTKDNSKSAENLNAAFLILLCGTEHPRYVEAKEYLDVMSKDSQWAGVIDFLQKGIWRIHGEIETVCSHDPEIRHALNETALWCRKKNTHRDEAGRSKIWGLFFPEGAWAQGDPDDKTASLRSKRHVRVTKMNDAPVQKPGREVVFLSNLLVTLPAQRDAIKDLPHEGRFRDALHHIYSEKQRYWYDHPIQIGVRNENNEAVYGLRGLDNAMAFEKERGVLSPKDRLTCLLSVSVTHDGLHHLVKEYLRAVYGGMAPFDHLRVYLFSEVDTNRMLEEVFEPALNQYLKGSNSGPLRRVFGVDGEYGRHYSFLKAMSALWQVLMDPAVKASFKIDLDQVFDQKVLVAETGRSALEHLMTPFWGAAGTDANGRPVDLGLLAGALVNAQDIEKGLFTPDVPLPETVPDGEALVFYSPLPQAISTRAEMMARYENFPSGGLNVCLQRVHVTGGTTGALVRSLRHHRPFTPTFIGRAEDQAYVMGSLFSGKKGNLRYLHQPGLIMRHDKTLFAQEAILGAKPGKYVGDLVRILLFSAYGEVLPWLVEKTKHEMDPFTGCFISRLPLTVVHLRLSLYLGTLFARNSAKTRHEGAELLKLATDRLKGVMDPLDGGPDVIGDQYAFEKSGWDLFYDLLDHLEESLLNNDPFALGLRKKARSLMEDCRL